MARMHASAKEPHMSEIAKHWIDGESIGLHRFGFDQPRDRSGTGPVGRRRRSRGSRGHRGRPPRVRHLALVPNPLSAPSSLERDGRPLRRPRRGTRHAGDEGKRQKDRRRPVRGELPRPHAPAHRGPGPDRYRHLRRGRAGAVVQRLCGASRVVVGVIVPWNSPVALLIRSLPRPPGTPSRSRCQGRPRS